MELVVQNSDSAVLEIQLPHSSVFLMCTRAPHRLFHPDAWGGKAKTTWGGSGEILVQMQLLYCLSALTVGV